MSDEHFAELFRLVRQALAVRKRRDVYGDILAAHMHDRPQGFITRETSGKVRQYRNSVSCDPDHLIDAALAHKMTSELEGGAA
jgi:hypothetical protein